MIPGREPGPGEPAPGWLRELAGVAQVTTSPVVKGFIDQGAQVTAGGDINIASAGDQVPPPVSSGSTFNPSQSVNTQSDTIAFPTDLGDGTEVQYQAGNTSTPIGGLDSAQLTLNVNVNSQGSGNFQIVRTDDNSWAAAGFTELDTAFLWASALMLLSSFAAYLIMKRIGILR